MMYGIREIDNLIDALINDEMQIIERTEYDAVIKHYDVVIDLHDGGMYGTFVEARTYDYDDYLRQNIKDMEVFKERIINEQRERVMLRIKQAAPYTGHSMMLRI